MRSTNKHTAEELEGYILLYLKEGTSSFSDIYRELPAEEVDLVLEIITMAEEELGEIFQSNLYITLADQLHFDLERHRKQLPLKNPLAWEIKRVYNKEYTIDQRAVLFINQRMNIQMADDEAASIALHLVNAQKEGQLIEEIMRTLGMVQNILNIVRIHFGFEFDEDSISYNRFVTHLQFFAKRVIDKLQYGSNDSFLFEQVQSS